MKKIAIGFIVLFATLAMVWSGAANAAEYPTKRIAYNICFNPGGESDITARIEEQALKKHLGVDVVINYKIGGGGALCWLELVQTKPGRLHLSPVTTFPHTVLQPLEMGDAGKTWTSSKSICSRALRMS